MLLQRCELYAACALGLARTWIRQWLEKGANIRIVRFKELSVCCVYGKNHSLWRCQPDMRKKHR